MRVKVSDLILRSDCPMGGYISLVNRSGSLRIKQILKWKTFLKLCVLIFKTATKLLEEITTVQYFFGKIYQDT